MTALPSGILAWNIAEIAAALKIGEADVHEYFTDGRRVSFILERRLAYEVLKGTLAPSEGAGYDLIDSVGKKWEVRSITQSGIYFCPSYMVRSGRSFHERDFIEKMDDIEGYIISDVDSFPQVPFWIIHKSTVRGWWDCGRLGTTTKISRKNALKLLESL